MGISNHTQSRRALRACDAGAVFHQHLPHALAPGVWLNKQTVELGLSVVPRQHGGKSDDCAVPFRNKHSPSGDLRKWEFDGIGIGEQGFAIPCIA